MCCGPGLQRAEHSVGAKREVTYADSNGVIDGVGDRGGDAANRHRDDDQAREERVTWPEPVVDAIPNDRPGEDEDTQAGR